MVRAIARQAEAERERRAKVIHAEGELQAAEKLGEAAAMLCSSRKALQLRYLQTLADMSTNGKSSIIVFPLPLDLIKPLMEAVSARGADAGAPSQPLAGMTAGPTGNGLPGEKPSTR